MKGMGSVSGVLVEDTVSLADGSLTVPSQRFIGASSVSSDFEQYPSDGLLGLAFASISRSSSPQPHLARAQRAIKSNADSFAPVFF